MKKMKIGHARGHGHGHEREKGLSSLFLPDFVPVPVPACVPDLLLKCEKAGYHS